MGTGNLLTPGAFSLCTPKTADNRGLFCKPFSEAVLASHESKLEVTEFYYSISSPGVLRGMHLQIPPHEHDKFVHVVEGKIIDVLLDVRVGSPTFGRAEGITLDSRHVTSVFVPKGVAHGFLVLEGPAITTYLVSSAYCPTHDTGIRWDSFGFDWGITPQLSDRDSNLPKFTDFQSPFIFNET